MAIRIPTPNRRIQRSVLLPAAAVLLMTCLPPAAVADDPCAEANHEARAMERDLRAALKGASRLGSFRVETPVTADAARALDLHYIADGDIVYTHALRAADDTARVNASVSDDGATLTWGHHSGGNRCCYCEYSLQLSRERLALRDTLANKTLSSKALRASATAPPTLATTISTAASNTDGSVLAQTLAGHFMGKRVAYRFPGSASEPPLDLSVLVCPDGNFVYHDHLAEKASNIGGGPAVRQGRWRIFSRSGRGIVELAFADGETAQYDAMVREGKTYIDGERVRLSDDSSACTSALTPHASGHSKSLERPLSNADVDAFLGSFRSAVQRRDRAELQKMMSPKFDYGNDFAVSPKAVFAALDFRGGTNWLILEKTLSQPVKPFQQPGATRPLLSAIHPAPCGEGCRFQSEVIFELDPSNQWRWKAMIFPGD